MKHTAFKLTMAFWSLLMSPDIFSQAPDVPTPAPAQKGKIYLTHATIHTGDGKVLNNATIGFENGKIIFLEENPTFKTDETMGQVVDCSGKHIYPGLIAAGTTLGLVEIDAVRATVDFAETGAFNPDSRAIIAYNTDSRVTPTVRSNGVLFAQCAPQGGWVSGTSAVVQLDAWNWEDALMKEDGIAMNWPSMINYSGEAARFEISKEYDKQVQSLKNYFSEAKSYYEAGIHAKTNLRFEAMKGLFEKRMNLYVSVNYVKEILNVIAFAESFNLNLVIMGGKDSYMIAEVLAQKKIPVILSKTHDLPSYTEDDIIQPYKTPAQLQKAGVLFALSIADGSWPARNLMFHAGTAAAYGMTKEEALATVTSNVAKILKVDDRIGTLAKGKDASLIISSGDVLDMKTSNIEMAFISGRKIDLSNKQKALSDKFSKKYGVN